MRDESRNDKIFKIWACDNSLRVLLLLVIKSFSSLIVIILQGSSDLISQILAFLLARTRRIVGVRFSGFKKFSINSFCLINCSFGDGIGYWWWGSFLNQLPFLSTIIPIFVFSPCSLIPNALVIKDKGASGTYDDMV